MSKFKSAEKTLQTISPDFRLDDFGETVAGYFLTLRKNPNDTLKQHGRKKAALVIRAKKALEKHGYIRFHEWQGDSLQICADIYWE